MYVSRKKMSLVLWIIHRHHCEQFSLEMELLSTKKAAPIKTVHSAFWGLLLVTETLFLERDVAIENFECLFWEVEHHK